MSLIQAAYFYAPKYIKPTATAWVSGNTPKASHLEPEQRVVPLFLIVLNLSVMSNFKKLQERQDKINKAVEKLVNYFDNECSIGGVYQAQAEAQIEIMSMMQMTEKYISHGQDLGEVFRPDNVTDYLWCINEILKLLRPFAEIAEEGWYVKE